MKKKFPCFISRSVFLLLTLGVTVFGVNATAASVLMGAPSSGLKKTPTAESKKKLKSAAVKPAAQTASPLSIQLTGGTNFFSWSGPYSFNGQTATQIMGSTNTPGTIVGAVGFGISAPIIVYPTNNAAPVVFDKFSDPTVASVSASTSLRYGTGAYPASTGYTTSDTNLNAVFNNYAYGNQTLSIQLINLVPGATYSVQLFSVDDRSSSSAYQLNFQSPTNSANISSTYYSGSNSYVIGSFVAPTNTVTLQQNLSSTNGVINALVVRAVSFTPAITFTQQPTNSSYVDLGSNATFSAMAYGPAGMTPQWVISSNGTNGPFTPLTNSTHISGATTYTLTLNSVVTSDANYSYLLNLGKSTNLATNSVITTNNSVLTTNYVTNSVTNYFNSTAASLTTYGNVGPTNYVTAAQGIGAVNSAIQNIYNSGGGTVVMGAGSFYGTVYMFPNVTLKGAGISNTVIVGPGVVVGSGNTNDPAESEGAYGNNEHSENFSIYGGISASFYQQGGYPGQGILLGDYNGDDHFQWYKNIEIEGCNIAMQLISVNGCNLINCNFHDNGIGFDHSIYFTGDFGILMTNCVSSWATTGDGVHNDFAGDLATYTYNQCDYSGNVGLGLLVQAQGQIDTGGSAEPHLQMYGDTIQFNGQDGGGQGAGDGLNCASQGAIESSRMDWNEGYGFNDNSKGNQVMVCSTLIGNADGYYTYGGTADLIQGTTQFTYDAAMADAVAGPNNTGDWVNGYNGYPGGASEGNVAFINGSHPVNGYITWSAVGAPTNGSYVIHCFYANGSTNTLAMPMTVNGAYAGTQLFPPTGSWSTYANNAGIAANLRSSNNSVRLDVLSPGLGAPVLQALYVPTAAPSTPAAPTGLTAVPDTNAPTVFMFTWEKLSWNPVPGATAYNIYRNGLPVAKNVPTTSYTFTHILGCGSTQSFEVTGVNQAGEGGYASVTCTSIAGFPLTCAATGSTNGISVSCGVSPNAKYYGVYRSKISGGPYTKIATTSSPGYTDYNVSAGTTYYYVTTAIDGNTQSMYSPEASASTYTPFNGTGLLDVDFGSAALQTGAAVLGTNGDKWNGVTGTTASLVVSSGAPATGIGLTFGGSGVYADTGGIAMDAATTPLMEDYAYGYTGATANITVSLTGLTAGSTFTLVVYAAGDNSGQGASLKLSGATGGNSGSTLNTSATSRQISAGNGVAYQTFTGTVGSGGTLTLTATELGGQSFTAVNGLQLSLIHP